MWNLVVIFPVGYIDWSHVWLCCYYFIWLSLSGQNCYHVDRMSRFLTYRCHGLVCLLDYQCEFSAYWFKLIYLLSYWCTCCSSLPNQIHYYCDILERLLMSRCYSLVYILHQQCGVLYQPILMICQCPIHQEFEFPVVSYGWHALCCLWKN